MMVSTRGRYALHMMIDLAQHEGQGSISLKAIAERQNLSMKYLEMIAALLNKSGLIVSMRGKEGGYMLARPADAITVSEVIMSAEKSLAPVSCVEDKDSPCDHADGCLTFPMWKHLEEIIDAYLSSVTIADLIEGRVQ